jgi:RHS repeat-associated protein
VYDAFGAELSATGTWKGPFGYAGGFGYQEDSSGLKLLGHRYYDSTTGRFLSRDKIKDGRNWYVYSGNQPATQTDPDGLAVVDLGGSWSSTYIGGLDYSLKVRIDTVTGDVAIAQDGGLSFGPQIGSGPGGAIAVKPGTIAANERSGGYSEGRGDLKPDDMVYSLGPFSFSHAVEGSGGSLGYNPDTDMDFEKEAKPVLGIAMRWQVFESELNVSTLLRQAKQGLSSIASEFSYMLDRLSNLKEYINPITRLNRVWAIE